MVFCAGTIITSFNQLKKSISSRILCNRKLIIKLTQIEKTALKPPEIILNSSFINIQKRPCDKFSMSSQNSFTNSSIIHKCTHGFFSKLQSEKNYNSLDKALLTDFLKFTKIYLNCTITGK